MKCLACLSKGFLHNSTSKAWSSGVNLSNGPASAGGRRGFGWASARAIGRAAAGALASLARFLSDSGGPGRRRRCPWLP